MARLLLDQNLSHRLVASIADSYPQSRHVRDVGLERAADVEVWDYAREEGLMIVSKDGDFHHLSLLRGAPPKVIWLRAGNCATDEIGAMLIANERVIDAFARSADDTLLILDVD